MFRLTLTIIGNEICYLEFETEQEAIDAKDNFYANMYRMGDAEVSEV